MARGDVRFHNAASIGSLATHSLSLGGTANAGDVILVASMIRANASPTMDGFTLVGKETQAAHGVSLFKKLAVGGETAASAVYGTADVGGMTNITIEGPFTSAEFGDLFDHTSQQKTSGTAIDPPAITARRAVLQSLLFLGAGGNINFTNVVPSAPHIELRDVGTAGSNSATNRRIYLSRRDPPGAAAGAVLDAKATLNTGASVLSGAFAIVLYAPPPPSSDGDTSPSAGCAVGIAAV